MNNDAIMQALKMIEESLPHNIEVLKSIIDDENVDAKTRINASRTLLSAENKLKQIMKRKGGEELSPKGNLSRG